MKVYVNTENKGTLNLRANPATNAEVLARIPNKTALDVSTMDETWAKVDYNGTTGYVMVKFLSTAIAREGLEKIYNSLKSTLKTIEEVLK